MASRFWVLGTGTWDAVTTTNWAASSGGAGGQSVPGSADSVTFDGSSGGGTVTVNTTITVQSITAGAFTGTLDFSTNNNNVTLSGNVGFNASGTATRTINLGNGTWTLSGVGTNWNLGNTTGLTFNANSSTISFTSGASTSQRQFASGGLTYNVVTFSANSSYGLCNLTGAGTFATLTVSTPQFFQIPASATQTITNAFNWSGSAGNYLYLNSNDASNQGTISVASGSPTMSYAGIHCVVFTGGATFSATNSYDLGRNSGITITAPSAGGGPVGQQLGM